MKDFDYKIEKCTPRALKLYHENGLDTLEGPKFFENLTITLTDTEKTKALCKAFWPDIPEDFDIENNLDVQKFREAILFFGERSIGITRGSAQPALN